MGRSKQGNTKLPSAAQQLRLLADPPHGWFVRLDGAELVTRHNLGVLSVIADRARADGRRVDGPDRLR